MASAWPARTGRRRSRAGLDRAREARAHPRVLAFDRREQSLHFVLVAHDPGPACAVRMPSSVRGLRVNLPLRRGARLSVRFRVVLMASA